LDEGRPSARPRSERYARDNSDRAREELLQNSTAASAPILPELEPRSNHESYLTSWLKVLSADKPGGFVAAGHARRAVTYLHHLQFEELGGEAVACSRASASA